MKRVKKEIELIVQYKTNIYRYGNSYGYNLTDGGDGAVGHKTSVESRQKMRESKIGKVGKECPNSRPVICDGVEYDSLTDFKQKNGFPRGNISGWLLGTVGMPKEYQERGLEYIK